jgi:cytochrome c peroxidase
MQSDQHKSILWLLTTVLLFLLILLVGIKEYSSSGDSDVAGETIWSHEELALLQSLALSIGNKPRSFEQQTNEFASSRAAAAFGHQLFFDTDLSHSGATACASCHHPDKAFTDGLVHPPTHSQPAPRNTPTLVGAALSPWQFWDGRSDSLWSQALEALESPLDHGMPRTEVIQLIKKKYRTDYEALFGILPASDDSAAIDRAFTNVGKAIGAYIARLEPAPGRFDRYVAGLVGSLDSAAPVERLTRTEIAGLKLFISDEKGQCISCHNGPLFTNNEFKSINVPDFSGSDRGRLAGAEEVLRNAFNCLGEFSDSEEESCSDLIYIKQNDPELTAAFKVPTLRNLSLTAPYMHSGLFPRLADVLRYYNHPLQRAGDHLDIVPLDMFPHELEQLEAFLMTLDGGINVDQKWLQPPENGRQQLSSSGISRATQAGFQRSEAPRVAVISSQH